MEVVYRGHGKCTLALTKEKKSTKRGVIVTKTIDHDNYKGSGPKTMSKE